MQDDRLALLKERAQQEYDQFLKTASFADEDIINTARKIVYMEEALSLIKSNVYDLQPEIEVFLYFESPLMEFCNYLDPDNENIKTAVYEELDSFLVEKQKELSWLSLNLDTLAPEDKIKVEEYTRRKNDFFTEENQNRAEYLEKIYQRVDADYTEALAYLERYEAIKGKPNEAYAEGIQAVYGQMKRLELWSTAELHTLSKVEEPLMMVYQCFKEIINGNPESKKDINTAIYGTIWTRFDIEQSHQKIMINNKEEEPEDEMEL